MIAGSQAFQQPMVFSCDHHAGSNDRRVRSAKMCQAHGGTYNTATQSCSYTASTTTAKQVCEEHTGDYDAAVQVCEFIP
jgi:hypothetical protein